MKALLTKDFYIITRQLKIFLFLIICCALNETNSKIGFCVIYASILPITVLAYDERSKWNSLADMLPYSVHDIVFGKYVLGYITITGAAILSAFFNIILLLVLQKPMQYEIFAIAVTALCIGTIILSLMLPFMFRYGVEKGRVIFYVFIALIATLTVGFGDKISGFIIANSANLRLTFVCFVVVTVVLNTLSIKISEKMYIKKRG